MKQNRNVSDRNTQPAVIVYSGGKCVVGDVYNNLVRLPHYLGRSNTSITLCYCTRELVTAEQTQHMKAWQSSHWVNLWNPVFTLTKCVEISQMIIHFHGDWVETGSCSMLCTAAKWSHSVLWKARLIPTANAQAWPKAGTLTISISSQQRETCLLQGRF